MKLAAHLGIWYAVLAVFLVALGSWWVYFLAQEGRTYEAVQMQRLANERLHALSVIERREDMAFAEFGALAETFPRLRFTRTDSAVVVDIDPEVAAAIRTEAGRRTTMFISEGVFFLGLLGAGVTILLLAYRREREFKQARELFLAGATHEFKTPLASLRLYTETLGRPEIDGEAGVRIRGRMLEDLRKIEDLVDQILVLGGDYDLTRHPQRRLDLAAECLNILLDLERFCNANGAQLETDLAPGCYILGQRLTLAMALRNLVQNAIHHSSAPAMVSVRLTSDGAWHRLAVADRGPGIPARLHQRIFDCFYSSPPLAAGAKPGTGLGLYLVKRMAERLGGHIEVASVEGAGTTFTLVLPAEQGVET